MKEEANIFSHSIVLETKYESGDKRKIGTLHVASANSAFTPKKNLSCFTPVKQIRKASETFASQSAVKGNNFHKSSFDILYGSKRKPLRKPFDPQARQTSIFAEKSPLDQKVDSIHLPDSKIDRSSLPGSEFVFEIPLAIPSNLPSSIELPKSHHRTLSGMTSSSKPSTKETFTRKPLAKRHTLIPLEHNKSPNPFKTEAWKNELSGLVNSASRFGSLLTGIQKPEKYSLAASSAYQEFLYTLFGSISLIKQLTFLKESSLSSYMLTLPKPKNVTCMYLPSIYIASKTVVLDLDETLVHAVEEGQKEDVKVMVPLLHEASLSVFFYPIKLFSSDSAFDRELSKCLKSCQNTSK